MCVLRTLAQLYLYYLIYFFIYGLLYFFWYMVDIFFLLTSKMILLPLYFSCWLNLSHGLCFNLFVLPFYVCFVCFLNKTFSALKKTRYLHDIIMRQIIVEWFKLATHAFSEPYHFSTLAQLYAVDMQVWVASKTIFQISLKFE